MVSSPSQSPSTFDPAVHLYSELSVPGSLDALQGSAFPVSSHSDELKAIVQHRRDETAAKTRAGVVVQHRAWDVRDVFRSDNTEAFQRAETPTTKSANRDAPIAIAPSSPVRHGSTTPDSTYLPIPSSPPSFAAMPMISSPVAYPASSSPPAPEKAKMVQDEASRKKRKLDVPNRSPLRDVAPNQAPRTVGGFIMDDSDDDDDDFFPTKTADGKRKVSCIEPAPPLVTQPEPSTDFPNPVNFPNPNGDLYDEPSVEPIDRVLSLPSATTSSYVQPLLATTCSGRSFYIGPKPRSARPTFEQLIASRSTASKPGRAQTSYYGIDIHALMDEAARDAEEAAQLRAAEKEAEEKEAVAMRQAGIKPSVERSGGRTLLWTEKYRARKFTDLVGDERTHRSVLRWLKRWDPIVFPGSAKPKPKSNGKSATGNRRDGERDDNDGEAPLRKVLLLAGPPGLGKTTLAHVCARQAGYEVAEINASDERSRDVVRNRIRDMVGTENVRGTTTTTTTINTSGGASGGPLQAQPQRKPGRPVCLVIDEVDGAAGGASASGGGEGGFVKALVDLIALDQRNAASAPSPSNATSAPTRRAARKSDRFRLLRPIILICNDPYHASLRPLRSFGAAVSPAGGGGGGSGPVAETIFVRRPPLPLVAARLESVFRRERVPADADGVRRLCEAAWGVSARGSPQGCGNGGLGAGTCEGDLRSVLVVAEWVGCKLRREALMGKFGGGRNGELVGRLTRKWVEENVGDELGGAVQGDGGGRSLGRGGAKEVVERVFREGAGFPMGLGLGKSGPVSGGEAMRGKVGVAEARKRGAMRRLREMVETSAEGDRIVTDCFTLYPTKPFQDDCYLTKPTAAYDWLHFHDSLSSALFTQQEWELQPYLAHTVLAFHSLFACNKSTTAASDATAFSTASSTSDPATQTEKQHPFSTPSAPFLAVEAQRANRSTLTALQGSLSPSLTRVFRSPEHVATELLPCLLRMLSPSITPVVIHNSATSTADKGRTATATIRKESEKALVRRAVSAMLATGVRFQRSRVVDAAESTAGRPAGGWVFRMEPPADEAGWFGDSLKGGSGAAGEDKVRFAVRQVLDAECAREERRMAEEARGRRGARAVVASAADGAGVEAKGEHGDAGAGAGSKKGGHAAVKRDFFGRVLSVAGTPAGLDDAAAAAGVSAATAVAAEVAVSAATGKVGGRAKGAHGKRDEGMVWVSYHEGYSNAVRKPITLEELMKGF
ncbi:hypothetical protein BDY21DRAFT_380230 [Lineolata rhizophorae]|uniref:AAA+ ATPase domain-containing protein n=1 Tax=Lineolata rhizophorae TaxID=578093 RepID=A0A6A6NXB0_9PEZI|nr:hypothetical protein BDY21DRAFT_380230 [Lineolata rhizophorae]